MPTRQQNIDAAERLNRLEGRRVANDRSRRLAPARMRATLAVSKSRLALHKLRATVASVEQRSQQVEDKAHANDVLQLALVATAIETQRRALHFYS